MCAAPLDAISLASNSIAIAANQKSYDTVRVRPACPLPSAFTVALQQHVPQQDFDCNTGRPFCQLCNRTVADVANTCTRYPACVAFVIDQQTGCSYLKASATTLAASTNHVTYCLDGRGAACAGELLCARQPARPKSESETCWQGVCRARMPGIARSQHM